MSSGPPSNDNEAEVCIVSAQVSEFWDSEGGTTLKEWV
jgi:hypothetical protein